MIISRKYEKKKNARNNNNCTKNVVSPDITLDNGKIILGKYTFQRELH